MNVKWDDVVNQTARGVVQAAWRILAHEADAEDVAQDVFIEAFRLVQAGDSAIRNWPAFLKRIATCRALDRLRERSLTVVSLTFDVARSESPDAELVARETAEQFHVALAELPPREAEVFCLRYYDDLSYQEIADVLEIDTNAVAAALHKARAKLADRLRERASWPSIVRPGEV